MCGHLEKMFLNLQLQDNIEAKCVCLFFSKNLNLFIGPCLLSFPFLCISIYVFHLDVEMLKAKYII